MSYIEYVTESLTESGATGTVSICRSKLRKYAVICICMCGLISVDLT